MKIVRACSNNINRIERSFRLIRTGARGPSGISSADTNIDGGSANSVYGPEDLFFDGGSADSIHGPEDATLDGGSA